jgi:hypothetical protein
MDFIFPPNLSFFYDEFRVGAWDMFRSQFKVLHWCNPASSVGTDGWNRWLENMVGANGKVGPNPGLVSIEYTK